MEHVKVESTDYVPSFQTDITGTVNQFSAQVHLSWLPARSEPSEREDVHPLSPKFEISAAGKITHDNGRAFLIVNRLVLCGALLPDWIPYTPII